MNRKPFFHAISLRPFTHVLLAVTLAILLVTPSWGAEVAQAEPPQAPAPKKPVFKKEEKHEFTGLMLKGQLKKPDLSYIYKRRGLRAEQIVNIPENFNEEIIQGAGQF